MLLVPFARTLDTLFEAVLDALQTRPALKRFGDAMIERARCRARRRRNLAALAELRTLDDDLLRDIGVNRIALARAQLSPRGCDPIIVLRKEAGLR